MRAQGSPSIRTRAHRTRALAAGTLMLAATPALPDSITVALRGPFGAATAAVHSIESSYRVKAVEGGPGTPGVRRTIERFASWTLICDETKGRRVCNATQSIADADGTLAFSWSLAATRGGEPVFLVRAPVMDDPARGVALTFGGTETAIRLGACDARLCVGFLPLDPAMVKQIGRRASAGIRYRSADGADHVAFTAPLDGLGAAIRSIR